MIIMLILLAFLTIKALPVPMKDHYNLRFLMIFKMYLLNKDLFLAMMLVLSIFLMVK